MCKAIENCFSFGEVKYLVDHKASIYKKDKNDGKTPLLKELSKTNCDDEIVRYLIEKKSDLKVKDYGRNSLLHFAFKKRNVLFFRKIQLLESALNLTNVPIWFFRKFYFTVSQKNL